MKRAHRQRGPSPPRVGQVGDAPALKSDLALWLEGRTAEQREKLIEWGLITHVGRALTEPLEDHLGDWHEAILTRNTSKGQADQQWSRASKVFRGCRFIDWGDIRGTAIEAWLAEQRQDELDDDGNVVRKRLSERTSNFYLGAVSSFCQWMREQGRAASDPMVRAKGVRVTDQQDRGVFTIEQVEHLLAETARQNVDNHGMPAATRCVLYRLAADTGQRHGLLRKLTAENFGTDPDGDLVMKVKATFQKNRTRYDVPIRPTLAKELGKLIARTPPGRALFPMKKGTGAAMVRIDLEAAGLPEFDEESQTRLGFTRCGTRRLRGS